MLVSQFPARKTVFYFLSQKNPREFDTITGNRKKSTQQQHKLHSMVIAVSSKWIFPGEFSSWKNMFFKYNFRCIFLHFIHFSVNLKLATKQKRIKIIQIRETMRSLISPIGCELKVDLHRHPLHLTSHLLEFFLFRTALNDIRQTYSFYPRCYPFLMEDFLERKQHTITRMFHAFLLMIK